MKAVSNSDFQLRYDFADRQPAMSARGAADDRRRSHGNGVSPTVPSSLNVSLPRTMRAALAAVMAIAITMTSACQRSEAIGYEYFRVTVDGQSTLGVSKKDATVRGVVVFFHGLDGNEFSMTSDEAHNAVTDALVNAGFAVVASQAGGNAFGNPASQNNYLALGYAALQRYRVDNIFFLAESMGALPALNLLASTEPGRIRGLAAINPILSLDSMHPEYGPFIAKSYQHQWEIDSANPLLRPPEAFRGKPIRMYVSRDDPAAAVDSTAFRDRFGSTDISIAECAGARGDQSCFQADDVLKWFASLEQRA